MNIIKLRSASLNLISDIGMQEKMLSMLSLSEQDRFIEFASEQQANQYLLGRAMLRHTLTQHAPEIMPNDWIIVADEYGKPQILGPLSDLSWKFNLSHSEDVVVLAFSKELEVGVDVEYVHRPSFNLDMAKHYFDSTEFELIKSRPLERQQEAVAQFWTLKESFLKAFGLGVRVPLKDLVFSYTDNDGLGFKLTKTAKRILGSSEHYHISLYSQGPGYVVALTNEVLTNNSEYLVDTCEWSLQEAFSPINLNPLKLKRKTLELDGCET